MNKRALPRVALLGTGGTIAATAAQSTALTDYTVSASIASVLAAVPEIAQIASVQYQQICNIDSRDMSNTQLLRIAAATQAALDSPDIDGVVITHGTDTLEETAYFLNLVLKSHKAVVVTGAMRPATALSADGPLNLYNAVLAACSPQAAGCGVLVVMNDQIHAARFVSKTHSSQTDAFRSEEHGCLGYLDNGQAYVLQRPSCAHTTQTPFNLAHLAKLPAVDIIYDHQSAGLHLYQACIAAGSRGLVVAGTGNGSLSSQARQGTKLAREHGIACVRATRVGQGRVSHSVHDLSLGLVAANSLNPQKARILLMLALCSTADAANPSALQAYFDTY